MNGKEFDVAATEVILHEHTNELLPMTAVAKQVGLSTSHLRRKFKQSFGITPTDYHAAIRLDRAALLLVYTRKSIMEVALECGYQDHAAFSRVFRRHFDMSPRTYRDTLRVTMGATKVAAKDARPVQVVEKEEASYFLVMRAFGEEQGSEESIRRHLLDLCPRGTKECILEPVCFVYDDPRITPEHRIRKDIGYRMAKRETWNPPLPLRWLCVEPGREIQTTLNCWDEFESVFQHMALGWALTHGEQIKVDHSRILYNDGKRDANGEPVMTLSIPLE
ncbi:MULTISPECIES: helix-turn-helix domain-containing protein [Larsenimonas]|uniref:AraC family transcriptional regulator n=1 Tax=Larsenimonas suaedae TaxID=1851019 RepID=A0ABU1GZ96_9GAMM|nr:MULTISPECIES: AraC family transcriptional regulator [Larsenimonas]MCM2971596.1 AraC family transcriptional regulator [Larsenimonas suaedae]MCM5703703.1 AraC family transcriptional regulator [Larsenimonas salina]MDR5896852.1 AraC family transcriptional regulator [Larsenimonas suaedae]